MKNIYLGLIGLLLVVVMVSGCTSSSNTTSETNTQADSTYKTYNGFLTFQYPESWTINQESPKWVLFNTPMGETRIWLYNTTDSPVKYSVFQEKKIDSTTYGTKTNTYEDTDDTVSYVIRKNGKDFFMVGVKGQESDYLHIIKTVQF